MRSCLLNWVRWIRSSKPDHPRNTSAAFHEISNALAINHAIEACALTAEERAIESQSRTSIAQARQAITAMGTSDFRRYPSPPIENIFPRFAAGLILPTLGTRVSAEKTKPPCPIFPAIEIAMPKTRQGMIQ